jgi:hypothetical protein
MLAVQSTTFTKKLPPVLAHLVYHPHVKARPYGCSASLRSLDMGWCVELWPAPDGDAVAALWQTADKNGEGQAHVRQERDMGDRFGGSS